MADFSSSPATIVDSTPVEERTLRDDISRRWTRFTNQEIANLTDKDALIEAVVARYRREKDAVAREVGWVVKDRAF